MDGSPAGRHFATEAAASAGRVDGATPPAKPRPPPPFFSGPSFSAAYGDLPAKEIGWQSGLALRWLSVFARFMWTRGTRFQAVDVTSGPIVLRLTRSPSI
jgi:hypothetical protein